MERLGFRLYILFVLSWFLHLTSRIRFLGSLRFDMLLVASLFLILFLLIQQNDFSFLKNDAERYLRILILYIVLSLPFVQWPGSVVRTGFQGFLKGAVFYYFTVMFITSEKRLKIFIFLFLACQTFRVFEPLYLHVTQGYWGSATFMAGDSLDRLSGAPHDIINPNGLAFVIVSVIPFYYYIGRLSPQVRIFFFLSLPLFLYALILTASRTGILALIIISMAILFKSKQKFLLVIIMTLAAIVILAHLSPELIDRYASIYDSSVKSAGTAQGRISGIKESFSVAFRRPIFGHGLGTSFEANYNFTGRPQLAHNLYAEIAQELGFVGLIIFLLFMKSIITNFLQTAKIFRQSTEHSRFLNQALNALQVWLVMCILFSFASYGLSSYTWYLFGGFSVVIMRLSSQLTSSEQIPSP